MSTNDPELAAMAAVANAIQDLDEETRKRVFEWAMKRYQVETGSPRWSDKGSEPDAPDRQRARFAEFVDLFDATSPRTDPERALVGGYWVQLNRDASDFQSQDVNEALKDVGHGVGNIADALAKLQRRTPALVRQVSKSGKSRQARKKYKVTAAGEAAIRGMLARDEAQAGESS